MPVSSSHSDQPCQHCQECGRKECSVVFRVQLDADLLHTLVSIYPEWFTTSTGGQSNTTTNNNQQQQQQLQQQTVSTGMQPVSPPKAEVDDSPLHNAMDKNKESLKVKLMLRRPINQLVAQGIMPPLKTPPAYHEQRQKLERAKMGDLLKAKIQQRPDREELVRQHILEDVGHVDPSLAERQRQLKKCRLADALNDQLSHRPGPLELIKKNILHTEEPIERAIKEGAIEFKATSEGTATKPTHPDHYMLDEDSSSLSPPPPSVSQSNLQVVSDEAIVTSTTVSQPPPAPPPLPPVTHQVAQANSTGIVTVLLTPTAAIALPAGATTIYSSSTNGRSPQQAQTVTQSVSVPSPASSISRDKSRKKSKAKAQPKTRTIKFHEYKGPPNAQKNNNQNSTPVETSYELLLQQQQLFLQWQLEWQHKYPRLLPASQKPNSNSSSETNRGNGHVPPPPPLPEQSPPPAPPKPLTNLEDMKVSDLKAELKRRNLPVSGAKPQLIERLKPFSESAASNSSSAASSSPAASSSVVSSQHTQDDSIPSVCSVSSSQTVGSSCGGAIMMDTTESPSSPSPTSPTSTATTSTTMESSVGTSTVAPDEIIRDQQRKIDMLQRQLNMQNQNTFQVIHIAQEPITNAKASLAAFLQQQQLNQLALQQSQQLITNNNNNNNNNNNSIKLIDAIKIEEDSQDGRTITLPNFKGTFLTNGSSDILNHIQPQECQTYLADNKHLFQIRPDTNKQMIVGECEEVKSQIVDDVLEILIKNGELPAIAAAEPVELSSLQEMDNNDLMEVDTDWLDSLMCSGSGGSGSNTNTCDPLLAVGPPSPFDLLIDEDFKLPHCGTTSTNDWDRMDFAI